MYSFSVILYPLLTKPSTCTATAASWCCCDVLRITELRIDYFKRISLLAATGLFTVSSHKYNEVKYLVDRDLFVYAVAAVDISENVNTLCCFHMRRCRYANFYWQSSKFTVTFRQNPSSVSDAGGFVRYCFTQFVGKVCMYYSLVYSQN